MAARGNVRLYCLAILLFISQLYMISGRMSKKLYPPMKEDIPFIKCDVCQKAVKYLFRKAKSMRDDTSTKVVHYFEKNGVPSPPPAHRCIFLYRKMLLTVPISV